MSSTIAKDARETLRQLFGEERYARFVSELNGRCQAKRRLFYWQEAMWNEVQRALGISVTEFQEIARLFRHCHIHHLDLAQGKVPILYGTVQLTGNYLTTRERYFPYANTVIFGGCSVDVPTEGNVFFCPTCRKEEHEWKKTHESSNKFTSK